MSGIQNFSRALLYLALFAMVALLVACGEQAEEGDETTTEEQVVNVYTHRHYDSDKKLFEQFEKETGIKVNVVTASADELIKKLEVEGENSPADVLVTVDAGRLNRAKEKGLLQSINSDVLNSAIPSHLRDADGQWYGLTKRARVIAYAKDRVKPEDVATYESLTGGALKGKVLIRSSENVYNQSLLAAMIAELGRDNAKAWAEGIVNNMSRDPSGGDTDQLKGVAAGTGDVAVVNSYYVGRLSASDNEEERKVYDQIGVIFPNQDGRGAHINVSGAGVTAHSKNKENAIKLLEFLVSEGAQSSLVSENFEYPVNPNVPVSDVLKSWGEFKADTINLSLLGEYNAEAVAVFDEVGWK